MTAERGASSAGLGREERSSRFPSGLVVLAALALVGVGGVIVYGYLARPGWIGVTDKKFWDYLELLIVPAALAIGVYLLNRAQSEREGKAEEARRERELDVENQRAQDTALQAYLDQMSQLLTDKERPLRRARAERKDDLSVIARAWTLSVLARLDDRRKKIVLLFLQDSGLITVGRVVVPLEGADLSGAELSVASLNLPSQTILRRGAIAGRGYLDLSQVDLGWAD